MVWWTRKPARPGSLQASSESYRRAAAGEPYRRSEQPSVTRRSDADLTLGKDTLVVGVILLVLAYLAHWSDLLATVTRLFMGFDQGR